MSKEIFSVVSDRQISVNANRDFNSVKSISSIVNIDPDYNQYEVWNPVFKDPDRTGIYGKKALLLSFDSILSSYDLIEDLEESSFYPLTLQELMCFAICAPDPTMDQPIMALGSVLKVGLGYHIPILVPNQSAWDLKVYIRSSCDRVSTDYLIASSEEW